MTGDSTTQNILTSKNAIATIFSNFVSNDRALIARRLKADGHYKRTSQIARIIYGEANHSTMTQVGKLLKEAK